MTRDNDRSSVQIPNSANNFFSFFFQPVYRIVSINPSQRNRVPNSRKHPAKDESFYFSFFASCGTLLTVWATRG